MLRDQGENAGFRKRRLPTVNYITGTGNEPNYWLTPSGATATGLFTFEKTRVDGIALGGAQSVVRGGLATTISAAAM
jgi:hypothetical protein